MATPAIKRTLAPVAGLVGLLASTLAAAAPSGLAASEREPPVQPRGAAMGDVQPPNHGLIATVGGAAASGTITVSHIAGSIDLMPDCTLGPVTGDPGVMITAPPISGPIPPGSSDMTTASCSGTAAGTAQATYTCIETGGGFFANDNTVIDCTITPPPANMDVQPPNLPLMALVNSPPTNGAITISETGGGSTLNPNCSLGAVMGDPGVMISALPFSSQIPAGGSNSVPARCSGTAAGFATATYTCTDADPMTTVTNDNTVVDCIVAAATDLSLNKIASVMTANVGDPITYTLDVTNNGPSAVANGSFSVVDVLPGRVAFVGVTAADFSCIDDSGMVTCDYVGMAAPSGSTFQIQIDVTAIAGGSAVNTATVAANPPASDPNPGNDQDNAVVTINPLVDLDISKGVNFGVAKQQPGLKGAVLVGETFTYTLAIGNQGPDAAPAFTVSDTLPPEVAFIAATGPSFNCNHSGGVVTCTYTGPALPVAGVTGIDIDVIATEAGTASNTATVAATGGAVDADPTNNTSNTQDVAIGASADLALNKIASASNVSLGDPLTYTVTVTNNGPSPATGFTVNDPLPPEFGFVGVNAPDFACMETGGTVDCNYTGPGLGSGQSAAIDINVTAMAEGTTTNTATTSADPAAVDLDPTNNADSAMVVIGPAADLSVTKIASVTNALIGDPISYTLDVTNNGPSDATGFLVDDVLPGQVAFVDASATDFNCMESAGLVSCNFISSALSSGQTSTITINVTALADGTANNTATVNADPTAPDPDLGNNSDAAVVTIGAIADLSLSKSASVSGAIVGDAFDFLLDVANLGPQPATAFTVTDTLPSQVSYNGFSAADFDCNAAGQVFTCNYIGNGLGAGQSTGIALNVTAASPGTATNSAVVGADAVAMDPDPSNNSAVHAVAIGGQTQGVDLALEKSAVASSRVGFNFSYLLRVTNVGSQAATGVRISDALPAGIDYHDSVGDDWRCQPSGGTIECSYQRGPLAPGETTVVRLAVIATEPGTPVNTATVSQLETDANPGNNTDTATVRIDPAVDADLSLVKSSLPDTVTVGAPFQYQLTVRNAGPGTAGGVVIADTLPPGVQFGSASGMVWACTPADAPLSCALSDPLPAGAEATLTLNVTAPAEPGTIVNRASVSAAGIDPNPADNESSAQTTVIDTEVPPSADLAVLKQVNRASAVQGDVLAYEITVVNAGPASASGVRLTDPIPAGVELASISNPGWSCAATTSEIVCDLLQALAPGASAGISVSGQVLSSSGSIVNVATVDSETDDPEPGNNVSAATTAVTGFGAPADLEVVIDDSLDPVLIGDAFDYFLTLRNNGPGMARGIQLVGTLPAGVTLVNLATPMGFGCQVNGTALTCNSPDPLIVGAERLFTVSVLAPDAAGAIVFSAEVAIVELGIDNNLANNAATEETEVRVTPTEAELSAALLAALGGLDDPVVTENLLPTAALCANPPPPLIPLCREIVAALAEGREDEIAEAIRQLVGRQTLTQHTALVEANANQFRNIDARQTFLRGGGGGGELSLNGLNFRYGNEVLPLSFLQSAEDPDEPEIASEGLIKPWGFFINGTLSGGEKDPTTREVGFDFDTYGITAGVDYRFSTRLVGGAAIGYADFDSDSPDGSELTTDGFTYHAYLSYYPRDSFYLDGRLSYGKINLDQRRPIRFTIGALTVDDVATSDTDADQFSGAFGIGLLFHKGGWSFSPRASVSFMDAKIDGFTETGTDFALVYDDQDVQSLILSAGFTASKVFSLARGVLTPQFDFSFEHESQNDDNAFNSQIVGAAGGSAFFVDADEPDRNYANAGLGLVFVGANGRQAFLSYRRILGLGDFSRWTLNAGFRFEF